MLAAAYPRQQISQATFDVYAAAISDIEFGAGLAACEVLIREWPFFPAISEVRDVSIGGIWALRGMTGEEMRNFRA